MREKLVFRIDLEARVRQDSNDIFGRQFQLTKRELEILRLLKMEYTNQAIADKLFLRFTQLRHIEKISSKN